MLRRNNMSATLLCMNAQVDWEEYKIFLALMRKPSLMAAAEELGIHHATVLRRVKAFEERLGVKLFVRHSRGHTPTEDAIEMQRKLEEVENLLSSVDLIAEQSRGEICGPLTITAPPGIVNMLRPTILAFTREYPDIKLNFYNTNEFVKLEKSEAHIAFRPGKKPEELDYISHKVGTVNAALYATKSYVKKYGALSSIKEVNGHRFILTGRELSHIPIIKWMCNSIPEESILFRTNLYSDIASSVICGHGIGPMLLNEAQFHPSLEQVMAPKKEWSNGLHLIYHMNLKINKKISTFVKFFLANFKAL